MTSPITLFQYPGEEGLPSLSPPCTAIQLLLRRMGLEYKVRNLKSPLEAKRHSPTGRLPAIDIGGRAVSDSVAIADFLEQSFPGKLEFPDDPYAQAQDRLWSLVATDTFYWYVVYLRWLVKEHRSRLFDRVSRKNAFIGRIVLPLFMVREIRQRCVGQSIGNRRESEVLDACHRALAMVRDGLRGGPFLDGRAVPGRGDMAVAAQWLQFRFGGCMPKAAALLDKFPEVVEHTSRVFEACHFEVPSWWHSSGTECASRAL